MVAGIPRNDVDDTNVVMDSFFGVSGTTARIPEEEYIGRRRHEARRRQGGAPFPITWTLPTTDPAILRTLQNLGVRKHELEEELENQLGLPRGSVDLQSLGFGLTPGFLIPGTTPVQDDDGWSTRAYVLLALLLASLIGLAVALSWALCNWPCCCDGSDVYWSGTSDSFTESSRTSKKSNSQKRYPLPTTRVNHSRFTPEPKYLPSPSPNPGPGTLPVMRMEIVEEKKVTTMSTRDPPAPDIGRVSVSPKGCNAGCETISPQDIGRVSEASAPMSDIELPVADPANKSAPQRLNISQREQPCDPCNTPNPCYPVPPPGYPLPPRLCPQQNGDRSPSLRTEMVQLSPTRDPTLPRTYHVFIPCKPERCGPNKYEYAVGGGRSPQAPIASDLDFMAQRPMGADARRRRRSRSLDRSCDPCGELRNEANRSNSLGAAPRPRDPTTRRRGRARARPGPARIDEEGISEEGVPLHVGPSVRRRSPVRGLAAPAPIAEEAKQQLPLQGLSEEGVPLHINTSTQEMVQMRPRQPPGNNPYNLPDCLSSRIINVNPEEGPAPAKRWRPQPRGVPMNLGR